MTKHLIKPSQTSALYDYDYELVTLVTVLLMLQMRKQITASKRKLKKRQTVRDGKNEEKIKIEGIALYTSSSGQSCERCKWKSNLIMPWKMTRKDDEGE